MDKDSTDMNLKAKIQSCAFEITYKFFAVKKIDNKGHACGIICRYKNLVSKEE
jgi:hypothetical protein